MADYTSEVKPISDVVRYWIGEIAAAQKREQAFRKEGERVLEIYNGNKKEQIPFNILYSNTETMLPALYNSQPRPVVQRRFKDEDPIGKEAARAGQRVLEFSIDTNAEDYAAFDDVMVDVVLDALLPGRGSCRVKYEPKVVGPEGQRMVSSELVVFDSLKWNRWVHGFARKWKNVPWIAFEHDVSKSEAVDLFGKGKASKMIFTSGEERDTEEHPAGKNAEDERTDEDRKTARVYEIWKKEGKKVCFIAPSYHEGYLKEDDDPLGLEGFFPMPEPLRFLRKSNDLMPTAIYSLYENQAKELNRITTRINRVVNALKVRGAYDTTLGDDIQSILTKDDNTMVAATNVAALQEGGLEKAIWLMPIDKLVTVFQQLVIARENCKKVIYEITGISDILRGASVASETATAQEIKQQWGTLRIKRLQKDVQRYARNALRLALEVAANKFNERTFAAMTGLPFATTQETQAAQGQVAAARAMAAMGQPVPPQAVQQAQAVLAKPQWAQVMATLRNDTQRQYRIDIETNSTVDLEATEDQKMMGDVLQAISQFIQGVAPLIQTKVMPFQVAQSMLLGIVRRYRFGSEIEDYIKAMQPPVDPKEGENAAKSKMEADKHQREMQREDQKLAHEKEVAAMELQFKREELQMKLAEMRAKAELAKILAQIKLAEAQAKLQTLQAQKQIEVAAAHAMPKDKPAAKSEGKADASA